MTKYYCDLCGAAIENRSDVYYASLQNVNSEHIDQICPDCCRTIEDFISKLRRDDNETA